MLRQCINKVIWTKNDITLFEKKKKKRQGSLLIKAYINLIK